MSEEVRYIDDFGLLELCVEFVEKNGGENFFTNKDWKKNLRKIVKCYQKNRQLHDRFESEQERKRQIFHELKRSKEIIENYLPGKVIEHLCYPWGVGSDLSIELSKKAGYISNFWGKAGNDLKNQPGQNPFKISRIGEDFLYCLPGKGRVSIVDVILKKIRKKLLTGSPYLGH
jgi:hypothetical protein